MVEVFVVPVLEDNYAYIIQSGDQCAVIDPGEAKPVVEALTKHLLEPDWIINTHKHWDHVDGNNEILEAYEDCKVAAPAECGGADVTLEDGDTFTLGDTNFQIILTKGHTEGHIVLFDPASKTLFSGDTLFSMGCGRLFEGSADDMFAAMCKIKALPPETLIYFGHEYTASNAKFATHLYPENQEILKRAGEVSSQPQTVPTRLDIELKTNPFLLVETLEEFGDFRARKDKF